MIFSGIRYNTSAFGRGLFHGIEHEEVLVDFSITVCDPESLLALTPRIQPLRSQA